MSLRAAAAAEQKAVVADGGVAADAVEMFQLRWLEIERQGAYVEGGVLSALKADTEQSPVAVAGSDARGLPAGWRNWREAMLTVGNPC